MEKILNTINNIRKNVAKDTSDVDLMNKLDDMTLSVYATLTSVSVEVNIGKNSREKLEDMAKNILIRTILVSELYNKLITFNDLREDMQDKIIDNFYSYEFYFLFNNRDIFSSVDKIRDEHFNPIFEGEYEDALKIRKRAIVEILVSVLTEFKKYEFKSFEIKDSELEYEIDKTINSLRSIYK